MGWIEELGDPVIASPLVTRYWESKERPAVLLARLEKLGVDWYSPHEVEFIYETLHKYQPDFICEWGTNLGQSARVFYEAAKFAKLRCEIHSVELNQELSDRGIYVKDVNVHLHLGDGITVGAQLFIDSDRHRPLFFLDDSHVKEGVLTQLRTIKKRFPRAVMLVHDAYTVAMNGLDHQIVLHEPGVAVAEFLEEFPNYDVVSVLSGQTMLRLWPRAKT